MTTGAGAGIAAAGTTSYAGLLARIAADAATGRAVRDPATEELIGYAPVSSPDDVDRAVARARAAGSEWAETTEEERRAALLAIADAIDDSAEALAELLSREQGKPLNGLNARFEVQACAAWFRATAALDSPTEIVLDDGTVRAELRYRPLGVVAAISPWNWPMMIAAWQIAPALRMGNTVVAKPSEHTTLSGLAICAVARAALPDGVLEVVCGDGAIGDRLVGHPAVDKVMFTGSTATGRKVVERSADNLARLTLELGGNDPGIVLPDADPVAIAEAVFWGAFINTGQTCAALKRLYVHERMHDATCEALVDVAKRVPMGVGLDEQNLLGPLQNRMQWEVVDRLVRQARSSGARILIGGDPDPSAPGNFYPTTIVTDLAHDAPLVVEEQFGPALPIVAYRDLDEALGFANAGTAGLGASVWSTDDATARSVAGRIRAGTVWINSHGGVHPHVPFGGVGASGYGVEFGVEGLKGLGYPQVISG